MRQLGNIQQDELAARFGAYLLTQGLSAHVEQEEQGWSIWVREEDEVPQAKQELAKFEADPENARYQGVEKAAAAVQQEQRERQEQAKKNLVEVRTNWSRPAYEKVPLCVALIVISAVVTLWTDRGRDPTAHYLFFANPEELAAQADILFNIRQGELWRLISPIFVHFSGFHILFNMYWLYILGGQIERIRGTGRLAVIIICSAIVSNSAQSLAPTQWGAGVIRSGGMSGVLYALFGYVWVKSRLAPSMGFMLSDLTVIIMLAWLIFCMTGAAGPIGNIAHFSGLVIGVLIAYTPFVMQPQKSS